MDRYYANKKTQPNGDNEVHVQGCQRLPKAEHRQYLGEFSSCHGAIREAKRRDYHPNGCAHCCPACHTS